MIEFPPNILNNKINCLIIGNVYFCLFLCPSRSPNNKHILLGLRTKCAVTTGYPVTAGPLYPAAARGQPPPHHDREHHQGAVAYRDGQRCLGSFTGNDLLITITAWN